MPCKSRWEKAKSIVKQTYRGAKRAYKASKPYGKKLSKAYNTFMDYSEATKRNLENDLGSGFDLFGSEPKRRRKKRKH